MICSKNDASYAQAGAISFHPGGSILPRADHLNSTPIVMRNPASPHMHTWNMKKSDCPGVPGLCSDSNATAQPNTVNIIDDRRCVACVSLEIGCSFILSDCKSLDYSFSFPLNKECSSQSIS